MARQVLDSFLTTGPLSVRPSLPEPPTAQPAFACMSPSIAPQHKHNNLAPSTDSSQKNHYTRRRRRTPKFFPDLNYRRQNSASRYPYTHRGVHPVAHQSSIRCCSRLLHSLLLLLLLLLCCCVVLSFLISCQSGSTYVRYSLHQHFACATRASDDHDDSWCRSSLTLV